MTEYRNPLVVHLSMYKSSNVRTLERDGQTVIDVPARARMADVTSAVRDSLDGHDWVSLEFGNGATSSGYLRSHAAHVINAVSRAIGRDRDVPIADIASDGSAYLVGNLYSRHTERTPASDETVLAQRSDYADDAAWQRYQSDTLEAIGDTMPLTKDQIAALESPKRGLEESDIKGFHGWKSYTPVSPSLVRSLCIGVPGISSRTVRDVELLNADGSRAADGVKAITTAGLTGYAIPMSNVWGDTPRFQIAADPTAINVKLKVRTVDDRPVAGEDYYAKETGNYLFRLEENNQRSKLHVEKASGGEVTFKDVKGTFTCHLKDDVTQLLRDRGYRIPDEIGSITCQLGSKYQWLSKGDMIGTTKAVQDQVSPTQPGMVRVREPKQGNEYVAFVCEGALKGVIAAKYLDHKDANGVSMADRLVRPDDGIVLIQVPGVAASYMRRTRPIYENLTTPDGEPAHVRGTLVCLDADGRTNLSVAEGVHAAEVALREIAADNGAQNHGRDTVKVLCWDPANKGLDDALLAVAQGKITTDQLGLKWGTADELFPLDQAHRIKPVHIDFAHPAPASQIQNGPGDPGNKPGDGKPKPMKEFADAPDDGSGNDSPEKDDGIDNE